MITCTKVKASEPCREGAERGERRVLYITPKTGIIVVILIILGEGEGEKEGKKKMGKKKPKEQKKNGA